MVKNNAWTLLIIFPDVLILFFFFFYIVELDTYMENNLSILWLWVKNVYKESSNTDKTTL